MRSCPSFVDRTRYCHTPRSSGSNCTTVKLPECRSPIRLLCATVTCCPDLNLRAAMACLRRSVLQVDRYCVTDDYAQIAAYGHYVGGTARRKTPELVRYY